MKFTVELASVPDRDDLVAEIWVGTELLGEIRFDDGALRVQIYPRPDAEPWDISLDELTSALHLARQKMNG